MQARKTGGWLGQTIGHIVFNIRETNIRETNILFYFIAIENKILQQTKIPITIPYRHSINIYKHNNIILESKLLPCAQTENYLDES